MPLSDAQMEALQKAAPTKAEDPFEGTTLTKPSRPPSEKTPRSDEALRILGASMPYPAKD